MTGPARTARSRSTTASWASPAAASSRPGVSETEISVARPSVERSAGALVAGQSRTVATPGIRRSSAAVAVISEATAGALGSASIRPATC